MNSTVQKYRLSVKETTENQKVKKKKRQQKRTLADSGERYVKTRGTYESREGKNLSN